MVELKHQRADYTEGDRYKDNPATSVLLEEGRHIQAWTIGLEYWRSGRRTDGVD